jgi:hypothetical protein
VPELALPFEVPSRSDSLDRRAPAGGGGRGFTRVITDDVRSGRDAVAMSDLTTLP